MSRQATGSKEYRSRAKTWVGRVRGDDGKRTDWVDLCTNDETIAGKRLAAWVATGEPPSQSGKETFRTAAERILREQDGKACTADRRHRIRAYALPVIGHIEIAELKPPQIHSVLISMDRQRSLITRRAVKLGADVVADEMGLTEATLSKWIRALAAGELKTFSVDTVHHMRVDISRILGALVLEGAIPSNVAEGVELPEGVEYDDRPFVILNDDEVTRFFRRGFEAELMMACLMSREFAAQRTSDLLGADWSDYALGDCTDPALVWTALVRRPKTDKEGSTKYKKRRRRRVTVMYERVRLRIPDPVRAPLAAWRETQRDPRTGELPITGPLFPAMRGKNAGKRKASRGNSWAEPLRDALWAEGIVRPLPPRTENGKFLIGYDAAVGEARREHCAFQVDTDHTRRAVFHSFRRGSVTALIKAGVPLQIAMLITGHQSLSTFMGYNASGEALDIPIDSLATRGLEIDTGPAPSPPTPPTPPAPPPGPRVVHSQAEADALYGRGVIRFPAGGGAVEVTARPSPHPAAAAAGLAPAVHGLPPVEVATGLAAVLAQLVGLLAAGAGVGSIGPIDPAFGSMGDALTQLGGANSAKPKARPSGFEPETYGSGGRMGARKGSLSLTTPPTAPPPCEPSRGSIDPGSGSINPGEPLTVADGPELTQGLATEPAGTHGGDIASAVASPGEPIASTYLEGLEAAARGALAEHRWGELAVLRPLIEAEVQRQSATAPVSLEVVRAKRKDGGRR